MNYSINDDVKKLSKYLETKEYEKALDYIETLPSDQINSWQIQNILGIICLYCGQYEDAVSFFKKALRLNPDTPELYFDLAETYLKMQEYTNAEQMLKCYEYISGVSEETTDMHSEIEAAYENNPELNIQKNVLMIAYYFPPLSGSGVFRSMKFAKYLPESNWKPTIISTDLPPKGWDFRDNSLTDEISDDISVIRIPDYLNSEREYSISQDDVVKMLSILRVAFQNDPKATTIFSELISNNDNLANILTFPCSCFYWAVSVINYIETQMQPNKIPVIYTTSGPSSAHLIGFYMKKKYGTVWIADYRDPWTGNPYFHYDPSKIFDYLTFSLESTLLNTADCNITIANEFRSDYIHRFKLPEDKIVCITNGYDENDFSDIEKHSINKFTINYSGLLYTKQRSILPILQAIHELITDNQIDIKKICFKIVGEGNEETNLKYINKYGLHEIFEQTSYVSHKEALTANVNSNLLLLFVGDEPKFKPVFTGKVFEYLRSCKPILALAPKGGAVDKLLTLTGHGKTFQSTDHNGIKAMILECYQKWLVHDNKNENLELSKIKLYERRYLTMKLADLFNIYCKLNNHLLTNCMSTEELSKNVYDEAYKSGGADQSYHKHYTQSFYYPAWKNALSYMLLLNRNIKILEIGCGAGQFANLLFDNGFVNYMGFDYAEEGVKLSRQNNPEHQDDFFVADAFTTPEVASRQGLIICFEVLEHIDNDIELLNRIQKGTKMLLSVPNFDDPYHVRFFSSEKEVYDRYSETVQIYDVNKFELRPGYCLYYVIGEKK